MKKTKSVEPVTIKTDEMREEYQFDYSKAKPNRFAEKVGQDRLIVVLDPDIAAVFQTPQSVNRVLRALITTMPPLQKQDYVGNVES
jgi:hypothetical protein